jgi:hypothetical protein
MRQYSLHDLQKSEKLGLMGQVSWPTAETSVTNTPLLILRLAQLVDKKSQLYANQRITSQTFHAAFSSTPASFMQLIMSTFRGVN